jgi:hypothetical protein
VVAVDVDVIDEEELDDVASCDGKALLDVDVVAVVVDPAVEIGIPVVVVVARVDSAEFDVVGAV